MDVFCLRKMPAIYHIFDFFWFVIFSASGISRHRYAHNDTIK